jgi:hypothetical protein
MGCRKKSVEGEDQRTLCFAIMTSLACPVKETFYSIWSAFLVARRGEAVTSHRMSLRLLERRESCMSGLHGIASQFSQ